jgi:RND family efflux transporter MFP subunit
LRQRDTLGHNNFSSQSVVDQNLATRDTDRANLAQAKANTQLAAIDYTYTRVTAPFDGLVTAHLESVGQLVGGNTPTKLATIVQLQPIYVVFTISEQDVLRIRATIAGMGLTRADLAKVPVEVGLQTETGYPHQGKLDYAAPMVDPNTGTLLVRGELTNADRALLPGYFVRVRVPLGRGPALLVPDVAIGADQGGNYVLVVNGDNVVAQRSVTTGPLERTLRVIETGLKPDDRVVVAGLQRAIPGEHVVPQEQVAEAAAPTAKP